MDHIRLQFTTDQFRAILKTRIGVVEGMIAKHSADVEKRRRAAVELGTMAQGLMEHLNSPVDGLRAEVERLALIHDNLVPDATFTVTASEALAVVYNDRGVYGNVLAGY